MDEFMRLAVQEAKAAAVAGDYPYGAILARDHKIIGAARNHMNTHNDPTSHAGMEVVRAASLQETYAGTVMYASVFPCIMCVGPIVMLGIPKVVAGASWEGYEVSRSFLELHGVELEVLELEECRELIKLP